MARMREEEFYGLGPEMVAATASQLNKNSRDLRHKTYGEIVFGDLSRDVRFVLCADGVIDTLHRAQRRAHAHVLPLCCPSLAYEFGNPIRWVTGPLCIGGLNRYRPVSYPLHRPFQKSVQMINHSVARTRQAGKGDGNGTFLFRASSSVISGVVISVFFNGAIQHFPFKKPSGSKSYVSSTGKPLGEGIIGTPT